MEQFITSKKKLVDKLTVATVELFESLEKDHERGDFGKDSYLGMKAGVMTGIKMTLEAFNIDNASSTGMSLDVFSGAESKILKNEKKKEQE